MHEYLIPAGGVCVATGIFSMISGGFEANTGKPMAVSFSQMGYTGIDQITIHAGGYLGMLLVATGIFLLVLHNSTAWKKTGGY